MSAEPFAGPDEPGLPAPIAAMSFEEALAELEAGAGSQFDPVVVEALKAVLLEKEQ